MKVRQNEGKTFLLVEQEKLNHLLLHFVPKAHPVIFSVFNSPLKTPVLCCEGLVPLSQLNKTLSVAEKMSLVRQLLDIQQSLSSEGIMHGEISMESVGVSFLRSSKVKVSLSDVSCKFGSIVRTPSGVAGYIPASFQTRKTIFIATSHIDAFAIGCCLVYLFSYKPEIMESILKEEQFHIFELMKEWKTNKTFSLEKTLEHCMGFEDHTPVLEIVVDCLIGIENVASENEILEFSNMNLDLLTCN